MRISDWSSDVCSSDLAPAFRCRHIQQASLGSRLPPYADRPENLSRTIPAPRSKACRLHRSLSRSCRWLRGTTASVPAPISSPSRFHPETIPHRSEEHTSELQSLMRTSYAVFSLKKNKLNQTYPRYHSPHAPNY